MDTPFFLPQKLYCVIGWPLTQTLSPLLHNVGFQTLSIPAVYLKCQIKPEDLPRFMESVRLLPIAGCSVTIPHKTAVIPYLDKISPKAAQLGAVNTLSFDGTTLYGDNTDSAGFLAPLGTRDIAAMSFLLLGSGGAARAVLGGLVEKGAKQIFIATKSDRNHKALAKEFGGEAIDWKDRHSVTADCIINATPLGMHGTFEGETPFHFDQAAHIPDLVYDIVYNPLATRFLKEAKERGIPGISGQEMFFEQGNAQFRLWTGKDLPDAARVALHKALNG